MAPAWEETVRIMPLPCSLMVGRTTLVTFVTPKKLVSIKVLSSSSDTSSKAPLIPKPALLISTSILPNFLIPASTAAITSSFFVTSIMTGSTFSFFISGSVSLILRTVAITLSPFFTASSANAWPSPRPAPVIIHTLFMFFPFLI